MPVGKRERLRARNRAIVARYNYWTEVQRLRHDDAMRQLAENEFFLSEFQIMKILKAADVDIRTDTVPVPVVKCPSLTEEQLARFRDGVKVNK